MNNRTLNEFQLQDLYVTGAMNMIRGYAEWKIEEPINPYDLWNDTMAAVFPEGLEPEDFDAFTDRGIEQINGFFEAARERLRG
jgi:hypothetical protein